MKTSPWMESLGDPMFSNSSNQQGEVSISFQIPLAKFQTKGHEQRCSKLLEGVQLVTRGV